VTRVPQDDVRTLEHTLSGVLPLRALRYLFHRCHVVSVSRSRAHAKCVRCVSLGKLVCTYYLRAVPKKIIALNRNGCARVCVVRVRCGLT
jgi:hypothetical protein